MGKQDHKTYGTYVERNAEYAAHFLQVRRAYSMLHVDAQRQASFRLRLRPDPRRRKNAAMSVWKDRLAAFLRSEDGPTATEYAVLIAVICVAVIGALSSFGVHMDNLYTELSSTINVFGS
jgi:Flp pilus assembly pilin Flp